MDSYRLYCLDGAGRISQAEWLKALSDEDAVSQAKALKNGARTCEVWERGRLVATLRSEDLQS